MGEMLESQVKKKKNGVFSFVDGEIRSAEKIGGFFLVFFLYSRKEKRAIHTMSSFLYIFFFFKVGVSLARYIILLHLFAAVLRDRRRSSILTTFEFFFFSFFLGGSLLMISSIFSSSPGFHYFKVFVFFFFFYKMR